MQALRSRPGLLLALLAALVLGLGAAAMPGATPARAAARVANGGGCYTV
jgi:hypothetical protein